MSEPSSAREFSIIGTYFRPLAGVGALDLEDDAALWTPPAGRVLAISADALVEGVHFLARDPPSLVARKLVRVNLSDLAAMGAEPACYLLTIAVPSATPDGWFAAFAEGLALDQAEFGVTLLGGDTVSTPGPVTVSATVLGHLAPEERGLRRRGARAGDALWVTGTVGDAALGLRAFRGELEDPTGVLRQRYHLPEPRLELRLDGLVSACMDVSDGLVQDAAHLARAAGLGVVIDAALVPRSAAARAAGEVWLETCLTGGDDYELLMAVPPSSVDRLRAEASRSGIAMTAVGSFTSGGGVAVLDGAGGHMALRSPGWSHL